MKNIAILIFFIYHISYANILDNTWNKLLHYYNNSNQIVSKEFFLSNKYDPKPKDELKATIKLLNSKNGYKIACNFPARYLYILNNNYSIPSYNLSECKVLNDFIKNFKKDKLSLVFTSEYINNPSSAFGHTMLIFSNNNESINISDAIHFAAKTNDKDGFFKYIYNGFNGGYNGYFIREPFYKKIYEYNKLEQRYIYTYTLNFNKKEILYIIYHLFEIRKATFKYYFLNGNCATQTTDILSIITNNKRDDKLYYLPIDTIKSHKKYIKNINQFSPLFNKLNILIDKMSKKEINLFNKIIKNNSQIPQNSPDIVKEAMVYYTTFNFRKLNKVFKNYDNVMNQNYKKTNIKDSNKNPLKRTQPSNIGIGIFKNTNTNSKKSLYIHYRPLFIDIFDIQNSNLQQSNINTLTSSLLINNHIKLDKFDIASIKSFSTQTNFYKPISWSLYSGLNRANKKNKLMFNNELGIGRTINTVNNIKLSLLLNLGFDNEYIYIKPFLNISKYISTNIKINIDSSYKKYFNKYYYDKSIFLSYKKNDFLYTIKYNQNKVKSSSEDSYLFSLKYNF